METEAKRTLTSKLDSFRGTNPCQLNLGEVIQDGIQPFVKVLYSSKRKTHCSHCFKRCSTLSKCGRCQNIAYCGKQCQIADWKLAHKAECGLDFFVKNPPIPYPNDSSEYDHTHPLQVIRMLAILKLHPKKLDEYFGLWHGGKKSFKDLVSQVEDHFKVELAQSGRLIPEPESDDKKLLGICALMESSHLAKSIGPDFFPKGIMFANRESIFVRTLMELWDQFGIVLKDYGANKKGQGQEGQGGDAGVGRAIKSEDIGVGIFIPATVLQHSCSPNAVAIVGENGLMEIRSLEKLLPGEIPTINFLADTMGWEEKSHDEKLKILRSKYYPDRFLSCLGHGY